MRRAVCSGAHVVALWCGVLVRLPWRAVCSGAPACRVVRPLSYTPYRTPAPRRTPCRDCSRCLLCSACRVCNWSAVERRFHAIAAGETPLSAVMFAAFATGMPQNADFMQSRLGECPFRPEHLPRLQLKRCRTPFLCNRGRKNAPFGPNACRVCIWNAAEGRFHAIAAGRTPLPVGMLAAFATGMPQKADFVQSRPKKRPFWPECLPRTQLECRRTLISCNRGWENASSDRNVCRERPFPPECPAANIPFRRNACREHSF